MDNETIFIGLAVLLEFALVTAIVWGWLHEEQLIAFENRIAAAFRRKLRRAKRELLARWLAKDGLTVRPLNETETALRAMPPVTVSVDELLEIINRG